MSAEGDPAPPFGFKGRNSLPLVAVAPGVVGRSLLALYEGCRIEQPGGGVFAAVGGSAADLLLGFALADVGGVFAGFRFATGSPDVAGAEVLGEGGGPGGNG